MRTKHLLLCALFAALTAAGVFIKIPIPGTIMVFTLQTFFVFLSGLLLAPRYALISQFVYMAIGLIGLPVFSTGGGFAYVLQPSFGYIPGFALCAFLVSLLIRKNFTAGKTKKAAEILKIGVYSILSITAMYILGVAYMYFILNFYIGSPVSLGYIIVTYVGIFFFIDIAKFILALLIGTAVLNRLPKSLIE